ncbi:CDP-glucose 4,6-dehydratase [Bradyrhizobium sp. SZCCHNS1054]|uniref:CDP-glucose 4,6-dehydratase n=1 Tax=Bradyrhizobium sp. SZCCHNS1054 TaxID=3057301 RepID=UPI0029170776|nr:CDP-glucose 4,6-dehydratase [Bradyrhizobium sp. SZCCHNS1054]
MFSEIYSGLNVLVTGHNGFKGSWLTLWLEMLGAKVTGIALPPETKPNHWDMLRPNSHSYFIDIRDEKAVEAAVLQIRPQLVFHLAAQPLVRRSYRSPLETWATNVMGTANVLNACRQLSELRALVVVTTDKCYENKEWIWGYREIDPLGGHDPYSASKAGAELVAASYRRSFFDAPGLPLLATARAGNVLGGGDWSEDRLIPDVVRSIMAAATVEIRSPQATRPWQHVLECLSGYLLLGERLLKGDESCATAWNFGPGHDGNRSVGNVLETMKTSWPAVSWNVTEQPQPHEAHLLQLDTSKAHGDLGWRPVWTFEEGIAATTEWYRAWLEREEVLSSIQLERYIAKATERELAWAKGPHT